MNESLLSPEDPGSPVKHNHPPFRAKLRAVLSLIGHAFNPAVTTFLVASLLSRSLREGVSEITAEIFCFVLLFIANELFGSKQESTVKREGKETRDDNDSYETALISLGIFTTAVCRYLADVGWITPALTPFLLAVRVSPRTLPSSKNEAHSNSNRMFRFTWLPTAVAVVSVWILHPELTLSVTVVSFVAFLAQLSVFVSLVQLSEDGVDASNPPRVSKVIRNVSAQTCGFLLFTLIFMASFGLYQSSEKPDFLETAQLGLFKLAQVIGACHLALSHTPWEVVTTGYTFAYASSNLSDFAPFESILRTTVSLTALTETASLVPKTLQRRVTVLLFALVPLYGIFARGREELTSSIGGGSRAHHPITVLAHTALGEFETMLSRQSRTAEEAVTEYKRRYNRKPPPGFEDWFEYAKFKKSYIIDDFDDLTKSFEPYWEIKPAVMRWNLLKSSDAPWTGFAQSQFGNISTGSQDWVTHGMALLFQHIAAELPEFGVIINRLDEPRMLLPKKKSGFKSVLDLDKINKVVSRIDWFNGTEGNEMFDFVTKYCHGHPSWKSPRRRVKDFGIPFVQDMAWTKDMCAHPEYKDMHGFLNGPNSVLISEDAFPIMSQSKTSVFDDLLVPPVSYRIYASNGKYKGELDPAWNEKSPTIYWAGSTTGSHARNRTDWMNSHRQRFITKTRQLQKKPQTFLTEKRPGVWQKYTSVDILARLYDTRFTAIIQCELEACEAERSFFDFSEGMAEHEESYRHRFVFDLDGNTHSGRFYTLLESRSAVLKQTIFQEWHDERLYPWVHYIPISLGMEELPEVMRFLALTEEGDQIAQRIALNSAEWRRMALRADDELVYMYRLMLEYIRVLRDDRDEVS
ncbi:hypothetical protein HDK77DRAFT_487631 [Phyllosticta capitalensis]